MIVVAGEALVDLVPYAPHASYAPHAPRDVASPLSPLAPARGGGPYNTALALGRLGADVAFCSRVSTDAFGASLLARLSDEHVDVALVQRGPEPTALALATVDAHGSAAYTFYVADSADRYFTLPAQLPSGTSALSLGTCSLVLEPGASAYERLMRREAARGVPVALDPNIRPGLIADLAAYRARFAAWLPHVTLLKLSEEDADWLGADIPAWLAAGPAAVVVTHGGAGLSVHTRAGTRVTVPGEPVAVADTIAAGDTANAALLHALSARDALAPRALDRLTPADWQAVLTFAAGAAALTCSRTGAEPPYAEELRAPGELRAHGEVTGRGGGAAGRGEGSAGRGGDGAGRRVRAPGPGI